MIATAVLLFVAALIYAALLIEWPPRLHARRARRVSVNPCWPTCTCAERASGRQRSRRGRRRASPGREVT